MFAKVIDWITDVSGYATTIYKKKSLEKPGSGFEYLDPFFKNQFERFVLPLHPKRMKLEIIDIIEETKLDKTLRFKRTDAKLPPFRAGQYINLHVLINGIQTSRAFSISSKPGIDYIDLTIRKKENGFVSGYLLSEVKIGDTFISTGPVGHFYFEPLIDRKKLVFIAGGSGITPFMSMLREFDKIGFPLPVYLFYGTRRHDEIIFHAELEKLTDKHEMFHYLSIVSEPEQGYKGLTGFINKDLIKSNMPDINENATVLMCGPVAMYNFCIPELLELGVLRHKIRTDLPGTPDPVTKLPAWPDNINEKSRFTITLSDGKKPIKIINAPAIEPILNTLEQNNINLTAVCRSGACSKCRIKLISGTVFAPPWSRVRESDRAAGYIHSCVSYPISDIEIEI